MKTMFQTIILGIYVKVQGCITAEPPLDMHKSQGWKHSKNIYMSSDPKPFCDIPVYWVGL